MRDVAGGEGVRACMGPHNPGLADEALRSRVPNWSARILNGSLELMCRMSPFLGER